MSREERRGAAGAARKGRAGAHQRPAPGLHRYVWHPLSGRKRSVANSCDSYLGGSGLNNVCPTPKYR